MQRGVLKSLRAGSSVCTANGPAGPGRNLLFVNPGRVAVALRSVRNVPGNVWYSR